MKKAIAILLSSLVLLSSIGLSVIRHYCPMSKKSAYSFTAGNSCCGKNSGKCCKNQQIKFEKVKDNYTPSQITHAPASEFAVPLFTDVQPFLFSSLISNENIARTGHSPPINPISRCILFHSFLV